MAVYVNDAEGSSTYTSVDNNPLTGTPIGLLLVLTYAGLAVSSYANSATPSASTYTNDSEGA